MGSLVSLDNRLLSPRAARIEIFDRGFLYGDSVYEAIRTYQGFPFEWEDHLARLHRSAQQIELRIPLPDEELTARLRRVLRAARNPESQVRLIVTRGGGRLGLDPRLAVRGRSIFLVRPLQPLPARLYDKGVEAVLVPMSPGHRPADPSAKTGDYRAHVVALGKATESGAHEALMVDAHGHVTEGTNSNLFAVVKGTLITPPPGAILEGVTRRRVLALARTAGLRLEERSLSREEVARADELFLTSTMREVLPVTRLGGQPIADGQVGPVAKQLLASFRAGVAAWVEGRRRSP